MSDRKVLYEARLATEGRRFAIVCLMALVFGVGTGMVLVLVFEKFPDSFLLLALLVVVGALLGLQAMRMLKLSRNPGFYRITLDDYGLYVQSDDSSLAPAFSVLAPDLSRLVRVTVPGADRPDGHEYYAESKSGTRHKIEDFFVDDLDVMKMFDEITNRFHWVEVVEERREG